MNDSVIVALIAGLPGTMAAVGALIVTIRTGTKVAAVAARPDETLVKGAA